MDARFLGGLHDFARGGNDEFLVALAAVHFFGGAKLLLGLGERGRGVFVGQGDVRDADGVTRFKEFERRLAVDAKNSVFDFGVGRGIDAAAEKFVAGVDVFHFAERGGTENVFEYDGVSGLGDREIRFSGDNHANVCMSVMAFTWPAPLFSTTSPRFTARPPEKRPRERRSDIRGQTWWLRRGPRILLQSPYGCFVLHFGFAAGLLHQFGALKIDHGGATGAPVIDRFGGAGNIFDGAGGWRRLSERGRSEYAEQPVIARKADAIFTSKPPSPLRAIPFRRPLCGPDEHNDITSR